MPCAAHRLHFIMPCSATFLQRLFVRYVRGPGHPCKLRLVRWFTRHWFTRLIAPTESGIMVLEPADLIQNALLQYGHFEPATCALHRQLLEPGDVYVDVGTNVGAFSLLAAQCVGVHGKVVSIEPNPPIFARLLQNIALNSFATNVLPVCCAASDRAGFARLQIPPVANSGLARLAPATDGESFVVSTQPPSVILALAGVTQIKLLKIDVEGHELPVLTELFAAQRFPENIVLEYLPDEFPQHEKVIALLQAAGYRLQTLDSRPFEAGHAEENNLWATLEGRQP